MSDMTRRSFVQASTAAIGACAVGTPAPAQAADGGSQPGGRANGYVVMFATAPAQDDTHRRPVGHAEIIQRLQRDCAGVDFTVRDLTAGAKLDAVLNEVKELKRQQFDGVIIYGCPREYDLLRSGLLTINVAVLNDFMNIPFPLYRQNRVIGAMLDPWGFCADPRVSEKMFLDLIAKVKLIRALKRMKSEHILTVTDSPHVNVIYGDVRKNPPPDYNERILGAIDQTFGTRVTKIGTKEVVEEPYIRDLWSHESREANEIARRWIRNAVTMFGTTESEVVRSAKVYLAMKWLMERYNATAMAYHIRTLIPNPRREDYVVPCPATSEFQLHNIVAKCQSHLNILLSEMVLQYAYGRPSMLGDFSVDTYNNTSCVQHCEGPWNAWGDERRVPYKIRDHRERPVRKRNLPGVGVGWCILYPPYQPVTMWQLDVLSKEVLVHTGFTVPMYRGRVKYRDHFYDMM
ncbi:MAG: twin-arginine translocation signal domain-containing protein [Verrucomicrobiae bacterium]|nr:twin-arginine translocation signal domain-containing protein [Verrucomicrobiae bacterium]